MRRISKIAMLASTAFGAGLLGSCLQVEPGLQLADAAERCAAFSASEVLGAAAGSALWVEADEENGMPEFCEITAKVSPAANSSIGMVFRLPANWNGKLLGLGGGGWAGNVTLMGATTGLKAGYATAQTDGGHEGTGPWDNRWASNPEAVTDFSYRAIHETAVAGKKAVQAFYGQRHDRAYFQGCSTGGRMALMEAQRYPEDYDAIMASAPVYSLQVQSTAIFRNNGFSRPGARFGEADLKLVNDAVLKSCDGDDGLEDGLIGDPRSCSWQPEELKCTGVKTASCLSDVQVKTLNTMYDGQRAEDGSWVQFPLSRGGESLWSMFIATGGGNDPTSGGGMMGLKDQLWGADTPIDFGKLSARDVLRARSSEFARNYEATNPDLSAFFGRGGKLILWHGESDGGPSPVGTIDYLAALQKANPDAAAENVRLFLAPGVGHCAGGPGADVTDLPGVIDGWVNGGDAPETLIATRADGSLTRKLCAWPQTARYSGTGKPNDPASWQCVARKSS